MKSSFTPLTLVSLPVVLSPNKTTQTTTPNQSNPRTPTHENITTRCRDKCGQTNVIPGWLWWSFTDQEVWGLDRHTTTIVCFVILCAVPNLRDTAKWLVKHTGWPKHNLHSEQRPAFDAGLLENSKANHFHVQWQNNTVTKWRLPYMKKFSLELKRCYWANDKL